MFRYVRSFVLAVCAASLMACAHSPQQLKPTPHLVGVINPVGQGQPVMVRVVDDTGIPK